MSTVRVAFQGTHGAFSEDAAHALLPGAAVETVPFPDFAGVRRAVTSATAHYGVLPIENSIHGSVTGAYDVLAQGDVAVLDEIVQPIRLSLLGVRGTTASAIRRVISHPVALAQCDHFLGALTGAAVEAFYDTAGAAQHVAAEGDPTLAAIAGRPAGERYDLDVLATDIQDRADNATRFFLIGPRDAGVSPQPQDEARAWKAVLLLEADHRPGSLVRMLLPLAEHRLNLTRIESRPGEAIWSYRFFVELVTSEGTAALEQALEEVRTQASRVVMLGCFPLGTAGQASHGPRVS